MSALRRRWPAEVVAAGLSLAEGRRRLIGKFPDADRLWADGEAAQQASSHTAARWKARRFAEAEGAGGAPTEDLCCGLGGDTMALVEARGRDAVLAIDRSDVRAWMAACNAGCPTLVGDVSERRPSGLVHLDPARRDEERGERRFAAEEIEPSLRACLAIARAGRGAAIKLGPGLELPLVDAPEAEVEFLSQRGTLVQAVVWLGVLNRHPGERTATLLELGRSRSGMPGPVGRLAAPEDAAVGGWLLVPDPSLERSGLLGGLAAELGHGELAPGLGILATRQEAVAQAAAPWCTAYEILARPRAREEDVADALRSLGAGGARVRTRGKSADADTWTKALRLGGGDELDLFLLRAGDRRDAFVTRRGGGFA